MFAADSSSTASVVAAMAGVAGLLISTAGSVVIAYLAFKTAQLGKQVEVIHKATNSLATAMGEAKLAQGTAEGTAAGLAQGREESRAEPHAQGGSVPINVQAENMNVQAEAVTVSGKQAPGGRPKGDFRGKPDT